MNRNLQRFFFLDSLYFTSHVSLDSKKSVQTFEKGHIFFFVFSHPKCFILFFCCCCLRHQTITVRTMPCIIPSKRVVICVSKVENHLKFLDDNNKKGWRQTLRRRSAWRDHQKGLSRTAAQSLLRFCVVWGNKKRVNLQCIKYLLNATCHSVFSHKKSSKVCLLETKQFSSFHFVHVDLFLARKQCLSLV